MRAWFAISHYPGRPSACSSSHVRLSNCHFHPPKFLISARHQAVQVTWENYGFGDSYIFSQRSLDSASKKMQMWLSILWSHYFAYAIWLFVSNIYIVSVTVIVMRKRISSLRGRKQKGGRIQYACEFSEPSSPFEWRKSVLEFVRAGLSQGSEVVLGGLSLMSDYCFLSPVSQTSSLMADAFPSLYSFHMPALSQQAERQRVSARAGRESIYFSVLLLQSWSSIQLVRLCTEWAV